MIAFSQVMVAGVGLAGRIHQAQQVKVVEKVVTKVVTVSAPAAANSQVVVHAVPPTADLPPPLPPEAPLPPPRMVSTPPIADPQVERLVMEARKARIAGDMSTAILKLEEARDRAPHEPNTLFETGQVFEDMAAADPRQADQAADAYQEVYKLGVTGAGSLYEMAARKLRDGIEMPDAMRGQLSLGRPRIFRDDDYQDGEKIVITVPVRCAPGTTVSTQDIDLVVVPYDMTTKDGVQPGAKDLSETSYEFVSLPFDFATGEELIQATYIIRKQNDQQIHLYGKRKYYGQVVELRYKGEAIDTYAWPRHLATQAASLNSPLTPQQPMQDPMAPDFLQQEDIIDMNGGSVLPGKPSNTQASMPQIRPADPYPLPR